MNCFPNYWRHAMALASAVAALAACGGDDGAPAAVATAAADSAAVKWNAASMLAVTANDTVANGTPSLAIKTAPAHGSATIDGTSVRYTPATGYFGTDTLRYVLNVGDKTSEADVQITVSAELTLAGKVHDAPLPGASVVATLGATALPAVTAAADGSYSVTLLTADPSAFVSLRATGAGTQSGVVLASLVGDMRDIALLAVAAAASASSGSAFTVNTAALPAADITHVSTATAALAQQALGKTVASAADLASVLTQFSSSQVLDVATAIKLVADNGVALPTGTATTLALANNAAAVASFLAAQAAANASAYAAVQQAVLNDATLAAAPPLPTAANPTRTLLLVTGKGAASTGATRIVLNLDKSMDFVGAQGRSGTWSSSDGKQVSLVFATPLAVSGYSAEVDPATGDQYPVEYRSTGLTFRLLGSGSAAVTPATVRDEGGIYYLGGPKAGTTVPYDGHWDVLSAVSTPKAFVAADVASGTRWAGVVNDDSSTASGVVNQDVLRFGDGNAVTFERAGSTGTYQLVGGNIEVTVGNAVYVYTRLFTGPAGEERWLDLKRVGTALQWAFEAETVKVQPGLNFTVAALAQKWLSYINAAAADSKFFVNLQADSTAQGITASANGTETVSYRGTWTVVDGAMVFNRYPGNCTPGAAGCAITSVRTWTLLGTSGKRTYVMERLRFTNGTYDQYRTNVYTSP